LLSRLSESTSTASLRPATSLARPRPSVPVASMKAVTSAGQWAEMARLLKPFRDHAVQRLSIIRSELAENDEGLVAREAACPQCRERHIDELTINEDDSVVCSTCGRRYLLPGSEGGGA
jgi:hypothetical protein